MPKSITRETPYGRLSFTVASAVTDDDFVMVHRPKGKILGYWEIAKFGGELNAQGVKIWLDYISETTITRKVV